MKRHIKFSSIGQFRNIIKDVSHIAQYQGQDEEGNATMNRGVRLPIVNVTATEKIHGTNAAVCYSIPDGFWVQSRENIITPENDNAGCAAKAVQAKNAWESIIGALAKEYNIDLNDNIISVYYEWSGGNIQKNSACSGLGKRSIIFQHFKVSPIEPIEGQENVAYWLETSINAQDFTEELAKWVDDKDFDIYNIMNFPTYEMEIDFNNPTLYQNQLVKLVEKIEASSPVGQEFGKKENIGEGVVCTFEYKEQLHKFKVKGTKHSNSKVKTLAPVDGVKEQAKVDFANYACSAWRLEQMYQSVFDTLNGGSGDISKTGDFLRAVIKDIMKEETYVLLEKNLEPKEVNGIISKIARQWFMEQLDKETFQSTN